MTETIIGREEELAAVEAFLDGVEQGPCALVLSGEPGIGKTVLWEGGLEEARLRYRVLTCRGVEAEASLSFAGLSELLGDVLEEVGSSLVLPRRRALEVALLLAEPGETPLDPHAVGLAVLDVVRAVAERGPMVIALDDLQWLDPASAGAIQIALRRLREEPLGLFATLRLGPELGSPLELERSFPGERLERLTLGPLSVGALHRLLEERLGLELNRSELARVQEATAGNPFFALELGRELVRTNTRPAPGQALRVPDSLRELLGGRLARLPGETLDVLLLVAALARPNVDVVTAAHGDRDRVLRGLEAAVREGSSSWTTPRSVSRIRCSRRSATRRLRSGSAVPFTGRWPAWFRISRSRPGTWRSRRKGPMWSSRPRWTRQPSRPPRAGRPRRRPSSTSLP